MKVGDIIESYQGKFAKVVRVQEEGGLYTLSAWVATKDKAAEETVGIIALNAYGISQVIKGGANVPGAPKVEAAEEVKEEKKKAK